LAVRLSSLHLLHRDCRVKGLRLALVGTASLPSTDFFTSAGYYRWSTSALRFKRHSTARLARNPSMDRIIGSPATGR